MKQGQNRTYYGKPTKRQIIEAYFKSSALQNDKFF